MHQAFLKVENAFFEALRQGDAGALSGLLTHDFVIVDVMSGAENSREALVGAIQAGVVVFKSLDVVERRCRLFGDCAIVTGQTRMAGALAGAPFFAHSRYTHVIVRQEGVWRMASAQGTPITESSPATG